MTSGHFRNKGSKTCSKNYCDNTPPGNFKITKIGSKISKLYERMVVFMI